MAFRWAELWQWEGKVSRTKYAAVGVVGFAIKHNIDRAVAGLFLPNISRNYFFNYWEPLGKAARLASLTPVEVKLLATLLFLALPFIYVGITMTVGRLRDAGQPVWLTFLFFIPFLNLVFFAVLCLLPPRGIERKAKEEPEFTAKALGSWIPRSSLGSAAVAVGVTSVLGWVFVVYGSRFMGSYGWSLFVALPF